MEKRTIESILKFFKSSVEDKNPVSPHLWIEGASDLNILLEDEHDKYFVLEHNVAMQKAKLMEEPDMTSAKAKTIVEATPEHLEMRKQKGKVARIEEFIRLAKKRATLQDDRLNNQFGK